MRGAREPHWRDRTVANAADACLSEPRDTQAYQRLVDAIARRRAWLQPRLDETPPAVEDPAPPLVDDHIAPSACVASCAALRLRALHDTTPGKAVSGRDRRRAARLV